MHSVNEIWLSVMKAASKTPIDQYLGQIVETIW